MSFDIREIQKQNKTRQKNQTTVRYHYTPIKMVKVKIDHTKYW